MSTRSIRVLMFVPIGQRSPTEAGCVSEYWQWLRDAPCPAGVAEHRRSVDGFGVTNQSTLRYSV